MSEYVIRAGAPTDTSFLFATWLQSYRRSAFARPIPKSIYFATHHLVIERILTRPTVQVLVVCDPTDHNSIFAYSVTEQPGTLHFIYTKQVYRGHGLAKALIKEAGLDPDTLTFTHLAEDGPRLQKRYPYAKYNPYLL